MNNNKWNKQQIEHLKSDYKTKTAEDIAKQMKKSTYSIRNKLKDLEIKKEKFDKFLDMNVEELNYLAGLIDGEGSFFITHHKRISKRTGKLSCNYEVILKISNCSLQFRDYATKYNLPFAFQLRKKWQNKYDIVIGSFGLKGILRQIIPYLKIKKSVAYLVLDYINEKEGSWGKENKKAKKIRELVKKLNSKDRKNLYKLENKIVYLYNQKYKLGGKEW